MDGLTENQSLQLETNLHIL